MVRIGVEQSLEMSGPCKDSPFTWSCKRHWSEPAEYLDLRNYPTHISDRPLWLNQFLLWNWPVDKDWCFQDGELWRQSHQLGLPGWKLLNQEHAELCSSSAHCHMQISQPAKLFLVQVRDHTTQSAYITHTQPRELSQCIMSSIHTYTRDTISSLLKTTG